MRSILLALAAAAATGAAVPASAQVGVSVSVGAPGVYGRIDIGNEPPPPVVVQQPVVVTPGPVAGVRRPIYMYVPPAYQRDWRRYCGRYNACGQPVYFVQENWVRQHYHPAPPPPRPRYVGPPGHHPDGPPGHREKHHDDRDHRG